MAMKSLSFLAILSLLALTLPLVISSDPSPLQDFCIGVNNPANGGMHMTIFPSIFSFHFVIHLSFLILFFVTIISFCERKVLQGPKARDGG